MRTEQTACILCSRNCGLQVDVKDARLHRIRGDPDHPVSKGYLCQKAARLQYYQGSADRLQSPLRRQSDGTFVRIPWEEAISDIAQRLRALRARYGGRAFAFYGGGGQGNHLGGAYSRQLLKAMGSRFVYSSLAQEKTGDFWINGRLFGDQRCHGTEDVEHADFVLFIGTNPFQSHGIPNARDTLRTLQRDPGRTLVVIDPRRTETARMADVHLQVRPGTDAFLLAAMLAIIVRDGLHNKDFLRRRCTGFEEVARQLADVPIEDFIRRADVPLANVERVAHDFACATAACVRVDLGLQQSLHSTLNSYLEKLLFLLTGHFGKRGGNNLHSFFLPMLGHTDERNPRHWRTAHHGMHPIAGLYPPNILPDEIEHSGEDRIRALFVDSTNPVLSAANTPAYERALQRLELLVVVDVALTETAALAHYVLPAATQLEKWECTGFNLEFPDNAFHLRHPILPPRAETLPEPEIYTRLLEAMGEVPRSFPLLETLAAMEPNATGHLGYLMALGAKLARNRHLKPFAASIVYRTLGPVLRTTRSIPPGHIGAAAAAPLLGLALAFAAREPAAVRRAGHRGNRFVRGIRLFQAILNSPSGTFFARHQLKDVWGMIRHRDRRIHLHIPEMLAALAALQDEGEHTAPMVLLAGERRAYNANLIFRDPAWRKTDPYGTLRIHPSDAHALGLSDGDEVQCKSDGGELKAVASLDDSVRPGMVTLPHGYGTHAIGSAPDGPQVNRLTASDHCDPLARTPFHKYVPIELRRVGTAQPQRP